VPDFGHPSVTSNHANSKASNECETID